MKKLLAMTILACLVAAPLVHAETDQRKVKKAQKKLAQSQVQTARRPAVKSNAGAVQANRNNYRGQLKKSELSNTHNFNANKARNLKTNRNNLVVKNKSNNVTINRKVNKINKVNKNFVYRPDRVSFRDARYHFRRDRHDRFWWRNHYNRIVFYGGGYYYWNAGWWYPAYGYDPYYTNYVYDGPIYGYNYAAPGDITVRVQQALAQQGYYNGPIDGVIGSQTRAAIERYQVENGLNATAAIDQPTLETLGLA